MNTGHFFLWETKTKNQALLCRLGWLGTHRSTCLWFLGAGIKDVCCHAWLVGHFYFEIPFPEPVHRTSLFYNTETLPFFPTPILLRTAPTLPRKARLLPFSTCSGIRETVTSSLPPTRDALISGLDIRMKDGIKTKREGRVRGGLARAEPVPGVRVLAFYVVLVSRILGAPGSLSLGHAGHTTPYTPGSPRSGFRTSCSRRNPHRRPSSDRELIPRTRLIHRPAIFQRRKSGNLCCPADAMLPS